MATFLYNPDRKPKEELISEFVIRTEIYDEIMHDLETSAMDHPEQHYLLVGQRGAGKTTLLHRIKYGIEDSGKLKEKIIPILFTEEQYNISELVNVWESVAQQLEDYYGFEGLYEKIETNAAKKNFEELSYDLLEKHLKKKKKKLILLIDNIGDLLNKMQTTEVHRLREVLQTKAEIRLIAGSPYYLETALDYHQPLYEFFKVMRLDGLNRQETEKLLMTLAKVNGEIEKIGTIISETPERVETLRTLTGGVPRTIALMYRIFVEHNNEDALKDLERILDAVTPLYKHRMDDLPTQQQKIVDAVAKNWDGISIKELKGKLRIEGKIISAQLRQLAKEQIIQIVDTGTKNNLYFLKERFFNIWYLMRYGRKYDKQRVIWLVKFLESWCTANDLEDRIGDYIQKIKEGKLDDQLISFYGEVYTALKNVRLETKMILKESTPKHISEKVRIDDREIVRKAKEYFDLAEFGKALGLLQNLVKPPEEASRLVALMTAAISLSDRDVFFNYVDNLLKKLSSDNSSRKPSYFEELIVLVLKGFLAFISLPTKKYEEAYGSIKEFLSISSEFAHVPDSSTSILLNIYLEQFLAFNQINTVMKIFEDYPKLRDKIKPTYYATLKLIGNEDEFRKMPPEIESNVHEVIKTIQESQRRLQVSRGKQTD